jgi:hypothetical protein
VIACAHCGTAMPTPTGRASRKRYCNVECRKAAWRERHRNDTDSNDVVPDVLAVLAVPSAFPDDVPNHGGQHRCPHCRQLLAIISVVIPADAATVQPPEAPLTGHNSANLNSSPGEDDLATLGNFGERQQAAGSRRTGLQSRHARTGPQELRVLVRAESLRPRPARRGMLGAAPPSGHWVNSCSN